MFACVRVHAGTAGDGALTRFAQGYSPRVETIREGLVVFDVRGLERLFGGPADLAAHIGAAAAERGWQAGVALAHTRVTVLLLACARAGVTVVPAGREARHVAGLPLAWLAVVDAVEGAGARAGARGPQARVPRDESDESDGGGEAGRDEGADPTGHPRRVPRTLAAGSSRHYRMAPIPQAESPPASSESVARDPQAAAGTVSGGQSAGAGGLQRPSLEALDLLETLARWGLSSLGDFAVLPRDGIHGRLGEMGVRWHRLAHGQDVQPLVRDVADEPFVETMALEWPIEGLEPLSFVLARLLDPLGQRLERQQRGAVGLRLWLRLTTRAMHVRYLQVPVPLRDPKVLRTLLLLDLESHTAPAGIDEVTVSLDVAPGRVIQHSLLAPPLPPPDQVSTLVARLGALMGERRCGQPVLLDSHRPGAVALAPFAPGAGPARVSETSRQAGSTGRQRAGGDRRAAHVARRKADAPVPRLADEGQRHLAQGEPAAMLRRFRPPVPARVVVDDQGRPLRVATRRPGLPGGRVQQCAGPWRTSGEWWLEAPATGRRGGPWDRDEWDLALEDRATYRVSRDRSSGEWVVEGYWD
jgi:protein ImuB